MVLSDWITPRNKAFRQTALLYSFVAVAGFFLVVLNAKLLPVFFLIVGATLFLLDKKLLLISLYLIYVPTNGLIDRSDFLGGILGIQQILGVLAFAVLPKFRVIQKPSPKLQRLASDLLLVLLLYLSYTFFKNAFFGLFETSFADAVKKVLNLILLYGPLLLILRKCTADIIKGWVVIAAFLGVLNQVLYCYLSPYLPDLGFYSLGTEAFFSRTDVEGVGRFVGVMGNGDSNSLGVFFVLAIGFFLSHPRSFNRSSLIKGLAALCVVAIALTGSRTAFLSLVIIVILFLIKGGSSKARLQFMLGAIVVIAVSSPLWDTLLLRLSDASTEQLTADTSSNRIGKWLLYFKHIVERPLTLIRGSSETILIGFNNIFIAAHNFYIQVVYNAGLGFLTLFIYQFFLLARIIAKSASNNPLVYIALPFFAITNFVSDYGIFIYFCLYVALYSISRDEADAELSFE